MRDEFQEFLTWRKTDEGRLIEKMMIINSLLKPTEIKTHSDVVLKTGTKSVENFKSNGEKILVKEENKELNQEAKEQQKKSKLSEFLHEDEILNPSINKESNGNSTFAFEDLDCQNEPLQKLKQELMKQNEGQTEDIEEVYKMKTEKIQTYTDYYKAFNNKRKVKREIPDFLCGIEFDKLREGRKRIITLQMISNNTFGVTSNFFITSELIGICSKYCGKFDEKNKEIIIEFCHYPEFLTEIQAFAHQKKLIVYPVPYFVFDLINYPVPFSNEIIDDFIQHDYSKDLRKQVCVDDLPPSLLDNLYDYQKEGIKFAIKNFGRILLGDEMGVGKTIQALGIACLYQEDWPLLIIVPSSLRYCWRDEIMKWLDFIDKDQVQIIYRGNQEFNPSATIFITSYDLATLDADFLTKCNFRMIIADEVHYLKGRASDRSKNIVPLLMRAKRVILLSGTPMVAKPVELYNIVRVLRPDVFYEFDQFGYRYCAPKETPKGIEWDGASNTRELHFILDNRLMTRRLKTDVLTELPQKLRHKVYVPTEIGCQKKINMFIKKIQTWTHKIEKYKDKDDPFAFVTEEFERLTGREDLLNDPTLNALNDRGSYLSEAYAVTGKAKIKGVLKFIENLIDNKQKFLIFAHHYEVLDAIEDYCVRHFYNYIRIDGRVELQNRYKAVKKFQTEPECNIAILSLTASSQGITLTAANTVVFAELMWTPGILIQAEDRAHRIGQVNDVNVYYLVARNSVDEMIFPRLKFKCSIIAGTLDGGESKFILQQVNRKELKIAEKENKIKEKYSERYRKLSKINQGCNSEQSNISDFFFSKKHEITKNIKNSNNSCKNEIDSESKSQEIQQNSQIKSESKSNFVSLEENYDDDISVYSYDSDKSISTPPEPRLFSGPCAEEYFEICNKIDIQDESWDVYANPYFTEYRKLRSQKKRLVWDNQLFDKFTPVWKQLKGKIGRPKGRKNVTIDEQICLDMIDAEELELQKQIAEKRDKEARENEIEKSKPNGTKHKQKERRKNLDIEEIDVTGGNVSAYLGDYLQTRSMKVKRDAHSYSNNIFRRRE